MLEPPRQFTPCLSPLRTGPSYECIHYRYSEIAHSAISRGSSRSAWPSPRSAVHSAFNSKQPGESYVPRSVIRTSTMIFFYRMCFAASREGQFPVIFSYVSVKRLTPAPAVVLEVRIHERFWR